MSYPPASSPRYATRRKGKPNCTRVNAKLFCLSVNTKLRYLFLTDPAVPEGRILSVPIHSNRGQLDLFMGAWVCGEAEGDGGSLE